MRPTTVMVLLLPALFTTELRAEVFNNDSIVALTKAKIGDTALLAKIESLPCDYDLSVAQISRLKKSGVSNAVIAALIKRCNSTTVKSAVGPVDGLYHNRRPGVYLTLSLAGFQALEMIVPAYVAAGHSGGNGSLLFPHKSRLSLQGGSSRTVAQSPNPNFVIVLKGKSDANGGFAQSNEGSSGDLERIKLVKFDVKSNSRALTVDARSFFGSYIGPNPAKVIPTDVSAISSTVYKVNPKTSLEPGEYGFVATNADGAYEIYDFRVP